MERKEETTPQELFNFSRSYVRDGVLRAYANRFAVLAFLCGGVALLSLGFALYVRLQPPTIIRISPNGEVNVISGRPLFHKRTPAILANAATSPEPTRLVHSDTITREANDASPEDKKLRRRRSPGPSRTGDGSRFFLAVTKAGKDAEPVALGEEFPGEEAVMIASFQKDLPFYRVETWKVRAEKKGRQIVLRKQC